jgi:dTDP-4-dehydrorhamnose reductase
MRILVTGASGLLGLNLCLEKAKEHDIYGIVHQTQLVNVPFTLIRQDLTNKKILSKIFNQTKPELVLNCAAMANVDQCEKHPVVAAKINTEVPGYIAKSCAERAIPFVHISTDAVFDGEIGNYKETDTPNPLSIYAKTKLEGEKRVLDANRAALIARVNFFGFSITGRRSLAEFFLRNLISSKKVYGFIDILFSPMYVNDLVETLFNMVRKKLTGIYHVVSPDHLSKYDFGLLISEKFNLDGSLISPESFLKGDLIAKRSPNLFLNINKLLSTGIEVPNVALAVDHFYSAYIDGFSDQIQSFYGADRLLEEA